MMIGINELAFGTGHPNAAGCGSIEGGSCLFQTAGILSEDTLLVGAVLQAGEIGPELGRTLCREPVNHHVRTTLRLDQTVFLQVSQMLGNLYLGLAKHFLKMANAEGPLQEKMQDAKARTVAEALVDFNQIHSLNMLLYEYT
jgi:hypothetical protein